MAERGRVALGALLGALLALSLVSGAAALPWTYQTCGPSGDNCCEWSGNSAGAPMQDPSGGRAYPARDRA